MNFLWRIFFAYLAAILVAMLALPWVVKVYLVYFDWAVR